MIRKLDIQIEQGILDLLYKKLETTRWPDEMQGSGWTYGASLSYMKELVDYWIHNYDWRATEARINQFTNYLAEIDGHEIHFIHIKGKGDKTIPLIITHGWPGSFMELLKIAPYLTEFDKLSFDLVIPSMPGFGFSGKITTPGCNVIFIADLWYQLMQEMGYSKFGVQGGDFGAGVSTAMALKYPEHVLGMHLNYIPGNYEPVLEEGEELTETEKAYLQSEDEWYSREGGYSLQQRTKPLTLAYGLNDSPVGLCAWIVEKMYGWSDCHGDIESVYTKEELLDNVMIYWITETIHSSIRLYHENKLAPLLLGKDNYIQTPVGVARFKYEEPFPPRKFIERGFNVVHWTEFPEGGHFPAMEKPGLLANDIREFFTRITKTL